MHLKYIRMEANENVNAYKTDLVKKKLGKQMLIYAENVKCLKIRFGNKSPVSDFFCYFFVCEALLINEGLKRFFFVF